MLQYLNSFIHLVYVVLLAALFIFGLIQCKKHSFSGGIYFIVFLTLGNIYKFILGMPVTTEYFQSLLDHGSQTTNSWVYILRDLIGLIINFCAYYFLIIGLYRMWKSKVTH